MAIITVLSSTLSKFLNFDLAHLPLNSVKTRALQMEREDFDILDKEAMKKRPHFHAPVFVNEVLK